MNLASNACSVLSKRKFGPTNAVTSLDSIPYDILMSMFFYIRKMSIESYCLRASCPRLKWLLEDLMHHPKKIIVAAHTPSGFGQALHYNLPILTPKIVTKLQYSALEQGYWDSFEYLYQIDGRMFNPTNLLTAAIRRDRLQCVQNLLATIIKPTKDIYTVIFNVAANWGSLECLKYAMEHDINLVDLKDEAIYRASAFGHLNVIKHLFCAKDEIITHGGTSHDISLAAANGKLNVIQYFVSIGVDIGECLTSAVVSAANRGHLDVVKYLHSIGADTNYKGRAVYEAAKNGHLDVVKLLVSMGSDIRTDYDGALRYACQHGHLETVKYLVSLGADAAALEDESICLASKEGHIKIVKYLTSIGTNLRTNNDHPFRYAAVNGHRKVLRFLISKGVPLVTNNNYVEAVIKNGHLKTLKYLISIGFNIEGTKDDMLCSAALCGKVDIVKHLVSLGADFRTQNDYPFKFAIYNRHLQVVEYLASLGVVDIEYRKNLEFRIPIENGYVQVDDLVYTTSIETDIEDDFYNDDDDDDDDDDDNNENDAKIDVVLEIMDVIMRVDKNVDVDCASDVASCTSPYGNNFRSNFFANLEIVKYLTRHSLNMNHDSIWLATGKGYLKVAKYVYTDKDKNILCKSDTLPWHAIQEARFNIAKHLKSIRVVGTKKTSILSGIRDIVKNGYIAIQ